MVALVVLDSATSTSEQLEESLYLVTGGAGFIGSHTVRHLLASGEQVVVLDDLSTGFRHNLEGLDVRLVEGDVADPTAVANAMEGCSHVIHLAAMASVPASCADPVGSDRTNVRGTVVVLEAARQAGVERMVYASSSAVYGSTPELPKRESQTIHPESPYAAAKAADELYAQTFSRTLGLSTVGLRYFNVFGPQQDPKGPYAAVIPIFVSLALQGRALTVFGDGEQGRDFVPVQDVARANVLAATTPNIDGRVFNIGCGRLTTVNQLAAAILQTLGSKSEVAYLPPRAGDVLMSLADVSRANDELGWIPKADFDEALAETAAWYAKQAQRNIGCT